MRCYSTALAILEALTLALAETLVASLALPTLPETFCRHPHETKETQKESTSCNSTTNCSSSCRCGFFLFLLFAYNDLDRAIWLLLHSLQHQIVVHWLATSLIDDSSWWAKGAARHISIGHDLCLDLISLLVIVEAVDEARVQLWSHTDAVLLNSAHSGCEWIWLHSDSLVTVGFIREDQVPITRTSKRSLRVQATSILLWVKLCLEQGINNQRLWSVPVELTKVSHCLMCMYCAVSI